MTTQSTELLVTPFAERFPDTAGEPIDIYGFAVPLFLTDPASEYDAIRHRVAALEFSMLFKWDVTGEDAVAVADGIFSRNLRELGPRRIAYGVVVSEDGFMIDDATAIVLAPDHVRIIGGNPTTEKALEAAAAGRSAMISEVRGQWAVLSVQGPRSRALLQRVTERDMSDEAFPYYTYDPDVTVAGIPAHINRMGFTAELGYEVMVPVARALDLWDALFAVGDDLELQAASAAALMTARTEAGMIMGGLEYDETTTPYECRMGWAVDLDKGEFQGRSALVAHKDAVRTRVVSITSGASSEAIDGSRLFVDGEDVGFVTMAISSPALGGATLALARVDARAAKVGSVLSTGDEISATVVRTPAYDPERIRVRG